MPVWIHEQIARRARQLPARCAIEEGERRTTYAELLTHAQSIAGGLRGAGARPGDRVLILSPCCAEVVAAMLGALGARCAFVPLDPGASGQRQWAMAARCQPRWALVHPSLAAALPPLPGLERVWSSEPDAGVSPALDPGPADNPDNQGDDLAYVYFTSGSTGQPKGIAGRLGAIGQFMDWAVDAFSLSSSLRVSVLASPSYDAYLVDTLLPLCVGGAACVPGAGERARLGRWLDQAKVTLAHTVPSVVRALLQEDLPPGALGSLSMCWLAGEPLLPRDVAAFRARFGDRVSLFNLYGASETTLVRFFHQVREQDAARAHVPVGYPIADTWFFVREGEVYIQSPHCSLGYFGDEAATERAFVRSLAAADGQRGKGPIYRTGDLGYQLGPDDASPGALVIEGRVDRQVKIRGVRVSLEEIERQLGQHPQVRAAAVVDRVDRFGMGYLCAYVVPSGPEPPGAEALRGFLRRALPEPMIPSGFVRLDALPLTLTGKLDRASLPDPRSAAGSSLRIAPRDATEASLARLFCDILQREAIGVTDSFWDVGGHSLLLVVLLEQIRLRFGREVPIHDALREPTIEALAGLLRGRSGPAPPPSPARLVRLNDAAPDLDPIDCLHPPIGNAAGYLALARRLEPGHAVFGVEDTSGAFVDLPAQAAHYVALIERERGRVPGLLCGWSSGGIVAFEMARQIAARGEPAPHVVLFDSFTPSADPSAMDAVGLQMVRLMLVEMARGLADAPGDDELPGELLDALARILAPAFDLRLPSLTADQRARDIEGLNDLTQALSEASGRPLPTLPASDAGHPDPQKSFDYVLALASGLGMLPQGDGLAVLRRYAATHRHNMALVRGYRPPPGAYGGPVTLLRTPLSADEPDPTRGWARLCRRPPDVVPVLRDHFSWVYEPHAGAVARAVIEATARARR